ncbi:hypothetical protein ACMZOO_18025 (plasmid) [Catenovulum sp. SX2]|uniref:hypothetical protein n=1 Tax=Catenovulum sp. SX2 TaxID=3398614 RepID=UPI003F87F3D2
MNAATQNLGQALTELTQLPRISAATSGKTLSIGSGFNAVSFKDKDFAGQMDPLVMVDHYRMTQPTFGAHPHAGLHSK